MATHAASETIRACLRVGGVIAYPTEGVWGLGCLAGAEAAVMRILELKSRTVDKGLILLGTTAAQFDSVAMGLAAAAGAGWKPRDLARSAPRPGAVLDSWRE